LAVVQNANGLPSVMQQAARLRNGAFVLPGEQL
jgi:hypothetical protein